MRKEVVNCSTGKSTVVQMDDEEIASFNSHREKLRLEALNSPPTIEDRLTALEESVRAIINQGVK